MSIISNYIQKQVSNYINKECYSVDPDAVLIRDEQYKLIENRIWYYAMNASEIEKFYKNNIPSQGLYDSQSFYHKVKGKYPRIHAPIPKIITDSTVNLCFSENPELTINTGDDVLDEDLNNLIKDIIKDNDGNKLFKTIGTMLSYSGAIALKPTIDMNISDYVILQPYAKEDVDVNKKYGRITEIIFKDYYDQYVLKSYYGIGYINFKLFKGKDEVPLNTIEETANLTNIEFKDKSGRAVKALTAVYCENVSGKSDYDGLIDLFEAYDETLSTIDYIQRAVTPKRSVPSSLCEIDRATGKAIIPDSWTIEDNVVEVQDPESTIKNINEIVFTNPGTDSYREYLSYLLKTILSAVSLSQSTIGWDDSGSNQSGEALNIREKASLRKRAALITLYDNFLEDLTKLMLMYTTAVVTKESVIVDSSYLDYDYFCTFSEYSSPTFDSMVNTLTAALQAGLISQTEAIKELYQDEMSPEEQEAMIAEINSQRDMVLNSMYGEYQGVMDDSRTKMESEEATEITE